MNLENTWESICKQLFPRDAGLTVEVNLALTDPDGYFEEYSEDLMNRGIEDPAEMTPWLALVDGLIRRNALVEVDWKCDAADLIWNLKQLPICKDKAIDFSKIERSTANTEDLLKLAAGQLDAHSLDLLILDIDSDSYPLVVLPRERVNQVISDAQTLRQKVDVIERM